MGGEWQKIHELFYRLMPRVAIDDLGGAGGGGGRMFGYKLIGGCVPIIVITIEIENHVQKRLARTHSVFIANNVERIEQMKSICLNMPATKIE